MSREIIPAFCNQKGGSGKTAPCLATLLSLEMAGQPVGFPDIGMAMEFFSRNVVTY